MVFGLFWKTFKAIQETKTNSWSQETNFTEKSKEKVFIALQKKPLVLFSMQSPKIGCLLELLP